MIVSIAHARTIFPGFPEPSDHSFTILLPITMREIKDAIIDIISPAFHFKYFAGICLGTQISAGERMPQICLLCKDDYHF
jgi:hypothetical protein